MSWRAGVAAGAVRQQLPLVFVRPASCAWFLRTTAGPAPELRGRDRLGRAGVRQLHRVSRWCVEPVSSARVLPSRETISAVSGSYPYGHRTVLAQRRRCRRARRVSRLLALPVRPCRRAARWRVPRLCFPSALLFLARSPRRRRASAQSRDAVTDAPIAPRSGARTPCVQSWVVYVVRRARPGRRIPLSRGVPEIFPFRSVPGLLRSRVLVA